MKVDHSASENMAYYLDKMKMQRSLLRVVGTKKSIMTKEKREKGNQLTLGNYDVGGIACLSNGLLVTLDTASNKIKMFDRNFRYVSQTPVSVFSRCLTFTSDLEVAVLSDKTIYFYVLIGKVVRRESKVLAIRFIGIRFTYARNHFAILCNVPQTGSVLLVIDDKGNEINCIHRISSFGEVTNDLNIALDQTSDRMYCSSSKYKRIVGLSYNGDVVFGIEVSWTPHILMCVEEFLAVVNLRGKAIRFFKKKDGRTMDVAPIFLKRPPRHMIYDTFRRRLILFARSVNGAITVISVEKLLQLSLRV